MFSQQNILQENFVKVVGVHQKGPNFKRVEVFAEVGYWMLNYAFNIFEGHKLYESIGCGDKLHVKVNMS